MHRFYIELNLLVWSLPMTLGYDKEDKMIFLSLLFVHITFDVGPYIPVEKAKPLLRRDE